MSSANEDAQRAQETFNSALPQAPTRAPYQLPLLTNFGTIEHLTEGGVGATADVNSVGSQLG